MSTDNVTPIRPAASPPVEFPAAGGDAVTNDQTPATDLQAILTDIETAKIDIEGATTALETIEDDLGWLDESHIERDGMYQIIRLIRQSLQVSSRGIEQGLERARHAGAGRHLL